MKRRILGVLSSVVLSLGLLTGPVLSQEVTKEPTPVVVEEELPSEPTTPGLEVTPPDSAVEQLVNFILQLTYVSATAAGLVTTLTGSLKHIIPQVDPGLINLVLSVSLWVIYWLASQTGNVALFDSLVSGFDVILTGLLGAIITSFGATGIYHVARNNSIPLLGYKPPEKAAQTR